MSKYHEISDEKLIEILKAGDDEVMDYLLDKYKNLVRKNAKAMFMLGGDSDDLIQEGMIGLYKAIRGYNSDKDASFYSFADLCITRQIYSAIRKANRKKHMPLNDYISIYADTESDTMKNSDKKLLDRISDLSRDNPESLIISRENVKTIEEQLEKNLSVFEQEVIDLYISGNSYIQIAEILDKSPKSIDNALQRIKAKMRKIVEE